jgi:hypothetical protein
VGYPGGEFRCGYCGITDGLSFSIFWMMTCVFANQPQRRGDIALVCRSDSMIIRSLAWALSNRQPGSELSGCEVNVSSAASGQGRFSRSGDSGARPSPWLSKAVMVGARIRAVLGVSYEADENRAHANEFKLTREMFWAISRE